MEPTCRCHRGRSNSPLPAQQCCPRRAGLPAQCGSSLQRNDAGVWLCEYPGLSFQRCPVRACSLVSSLLLNGATMSQESSLTQSAHSVRQVLTAYRPHFSFIFPFTCFQFSSTRFQSMTHSFLRGPTTTPRPTFPAGGRVATC